MMTTVQEAPAAFDVTKLTDVREKVSSLPRRQSTVDDHRRLPPQSNTVPITERLFYKGDYEIYKDSITKPRLPAHKCCKHSKRRRARNVHRPDTHDSTTSFSETAIPPVPCEIVLRKDPPVRYSPLSTTSSRIYILLTILFFLYMATFLLLQPAPLLLLQHGMVNRSDPFQVVQRDIVWWQWRPDRICLAPSLGWWCRHHRRPDSLVSG